jgi:hypothetical protein
LRIIYAAPVPDSSDPRRIASWAGGAAMSSDPSARPAWIDAIAIIVGLVIADGVIVFVIGWIAPTSSAVCATYYNCVTEPRAEIRHTYVQMAVFGAVALLSLILVWWRFRPALVLVAVVQVLAVTLILYQGFSNVRDQHKRLPTFHGCRYINCRP